MYMIGGKIMRVLTTLTQNISLVIADQKKKVMHIFSFMKRVNSHYIKSEIYCKKSDWSRAFNQYTIMCKVEMIKAVSVADIVFIISCILSSYLTVWTSCLVSKRYIFSYGSKTIVYWIYFFRLILSHMMTYLTRVLVLMTFTRRSKQWGSLWPLKEQKEFLHQT